MGTQLTHRGHTNIIFFAPYGNQYYYCSSTHPSIMSEGGHVVAPREESPRLPAHQQEQEVGARQDEDQDQERPDRQPHNQEEDQEDDNDDGDDDDEVEVIMVTAPLDPINMTLTGEECDWALDIKEAIQATPELDPVSDLWCVQLALFVRNDVAGAVERTLHMQAFCQEYGVKDNLKDGVRFLRWLIHLFPRHLLEFTRDRGSCVLIHDATQMDTTVLTTPEKINMYMGCMYYLHHAFYPDIEAMRCGVTVLIECEGFSLCKRHYAKVLRKLFSEFLTVYPIVGGMKQFHTTMWWNILSCGLRRLLPKHVRDRCVTGCTFEGGRFDTIYLVPSVELANERVLRQLGESLRQRYDWESTFSLAAR